MTKDSEITEKWGQLSSCLTRINEKKTTLQKHDAEIEKVCKTLIFLFTSLYNPVFCSQAYKMLEDAFKMMGEEKDGVIKVHKEAERKLKVMQQEYEVVNLKVESKLEGM